jgi:hypothetical protein
VPHLRDSLIVAKVGHFRGSENPDTLNSPMPSGLKLFQREGDDQFITFSCYRCEPYLSKYVTDRNNVEASKRLTPALHHSQCGLDVLAIDLN